MIVSFDLRSPFDSRGEIAPSCDNLKKETFPSKVFNRNERNRCENGKKSEVYFTWSPSLDGGGDWEWRRRAFFRHRRHLSMKVSVVVKVGLDAVKVGLGLELTSGCRGTCGWMETCAFQPEIQLWRYCILHHNSCAHSKSPFHNWQDWRLTRVNRPKDLQSTTLMVSGGQYISWK